jgi:hypothetical protein
MKSTGNNCIFDGSNCAHCEIQRSIQLLLYSLVKLETDQTSDNQGDRSRDLYNPDTQG